MKAHRFGITVVAVACLAAALGAAAAPNDGSSDWLDALNARSAALNERYGLGDDAGRRALGAPGPGWLEALMARSDALNRKYGLGEYARRPAQTSVTPEWLAALHAGSVALNRHYGLGEFAPKR